MIWFAISSILLLFSLNFVQSRELVNRNEDYVVETNVGLIRGLRADDGNYTMFLGIPYATVNESNIFGNSIPHPPFEGIFEAYDESAICPQIEEFNFTTVGTLDCLHLNIYVPDTVSTENRLPVMVYIYGGGFNIGFAGKFLYGPKYLVRHDVILVTFNYRLGPYGFFCLDTPEVSGNQGLKDQVTALRWIRNNIEAFGGDPDKVTVFGNSAGAMSIGLHLISESERLFTNAIMQSGSAFFPNLASEGDINAPLVIAESLGLTTNDVNEALTFLSHTNVHSVIEATVSYNNFGPCLEKQLPGVERFLGNLAINADHSKAANIALLLGYNSDELLAFFPQEVNPDVWEVLPHMFQYNLFNTFNFDEATLAELEGIVKRFYIGDDDIDHKTELQVKNFMEDFIFVYPPIRSIKSYLDAGVEKVYQYLFAYDGNRNFVKVKDSISRAGVAHADEIGYLFDMDFIPTEPNNEDQLIIDRVTAMWTNFAKYGDPTPDTNSLLPIKWEPITRDSPYNYIIINSTLSAGQRYEHRRMSFWDLFFTAYGEFEKGYVSDQDEDEIEEVSEEETDNEESVEENVDGEDDVSEEESNVPASSSSAYLNPVLGLFVLLNNLIYHQFKQM